MNCEPPIASGGGAPGEEEGGGCNELGVCIVERTVRHKQKLSPFGDLDRQGEDEEHIALHLDVPV